LGRLIHTLARENDKVQETVYQYDFNGNRTATVLPDGRQINYLRPLQN
jgi:YD repeat-containing protein